MRKYEAKTKEEAVLAACKDKGCLEEELNYYVLEEKPGGLFGIGAKAVIEAFTKQDVADFIYEYLNNYFKNINMPAEVSVRLEDDCYYADINADNNAVLIGKAGQTLQAITNVAKSCASAEFKKHVNLLVDINGYKEERYEKLKNMVGKIAKTVVKTKVSARLGQMSNDERKIVHQYLSTFPHIKTESEGEGPNRRLKIIYVEK